MMHASKSCQPTLYYDCYPRPTCIRICRFAPRFSLLCASHLWQRHRVSSASTGRPQLLTVPTRVQTLNSVSFVTLKATDQAASWCRTHDQRGLSNESGCSALQKSGCSDCGPSFLFLPAFPKEVNTNAAGYSHRKGHPAELAGVAVQDCVQQLRFRYAQTSRSRRNYWYPICAAAARSPRLSS